jgi:type VI secretion system secreted protein Hcp
MALDASVKATGAKQAAFKHQNQIKSRAGTSVVTSVRYEIEAPRDAHTGLATGKREHKPVVFEFPMDSSVINWKTAIVNNETLNSVVFNFYQTVTAGLTQGTAPGSGGEGSPYYTIELKNAVVSKLEFVHPYSRAVDPEIKNKEIHVRVSLTFMEITCTWVQGGVTMNDNWLLGSQ